MDCRVYHTGEFAKRARVSLRTLRYYDAAGLLSPGRRTEAGYRLYTETDLQTLQRILALKFLGFSLDEIKRYLARGPRRLDSALAQQRAMLLDRRKQIDAILRAISQTERLLADGQPGWDAVTDVIERIQMEQKTEWMSKYFRPDQLQTLDALHKSAYSPEAQERLARRPEWTEADQERANAQWAHVAAEADRLAAAGADPAGDEGQELAAYKQALLDQFTQRDPQVEAGLKQFWERHNALPADQQPLAGVIPPIGSAGSAFLEQAMAALAERRAGN
ncbi:MAG TPA: MerR family transcriptional regulator [Chthonomonadaceae bacterium]|nr:MerR family transcriptional regulator [Chthonomonadaceae bacterium]